MFSKAVIRRNELRQVMSLTGRSTLALLLLLREAWIIDAHTSRTWAIETRITKADKMPSVVTKDS